MILRCEDFDVIWPVNESEFKAADQRDQLATSSLFKLNTCSCACFGLHSRLESLSNDVSFAHKCMPSKNRASCRRDVSPARPCAARCPWDTLFWRESFVRARIPSIFNSIETVAESVGARFVSAPVRFWSTIAHLWPVELDSGSVPAPPVLYDSGTVMLASQQIGGRDSHERSLDGRVRVFEVRVGVVRMVVVGVVGWSGASADCWLNLLRAALIGLVADARSPECRYPSE
jgi:hypothetical protein